MKQSIVTCCIFLFFFLVAFSPKANAGCLGVGQHGCAEGPSEYVGNTPGQVCCSGLACQCNLPATYPGQCIADGGTECVTISSTLRTVGPPFNYTPYYTCGTNGRYNQIFAYQNANLEAQLPDIVNEWCDAYGLTCSTTNGCVAPPAPGGGTLTCTNLGGTCVNFINSGCPAYTNNNNTSYDSTCAGSETGCCLPETCAQQGGQCINGATQSVPSGYTYDSAGADTLDANCQATHGGNPNEICVQPYSNFSSCTSGTSSCQTCNATAPGTNTCGQYSGSQTCTHANTQPCNPRTFSNACTTSLQNHCSANYTCPIGSGGPVACETTLTVQVYKDYNHDAIGTNDPGFAGISVTLKTSGGSTIATQTTAANGRTTFSGLTTGNYTVTTAIPANFVTTTTNPRAVTLTTANGGTTVFPGIAPLYKISGTVYNDNNKNQNLDGSETGYTSGGTITVTNGPTSVSPITVSGSGTYTTPNLLSGTYRLTYTGALAAGYNFTTPSTWTVTVGDPAGSPDCNKSTSQDAVCGSQNNGSITGLNIGVTNENPWDQSACFDVRNDSGTYTDQIPANPSCGGVTGAYNTVTAGSCATGAGVVFTCDATPDFGLGSSNVNGWQAGGAGTQQECFTGAGLDVVRTSYDYLLTTARESGIVPTDMSTLCSLANCTLPGNLAKGVYIAHGDVHLNTYTFPVDPVTPQSFIFLIDGNLYIDGNILIPAGSVAAFSTSGDIHVDKSVGNVVSDPNDASVNDPNVEGLYSADGSFIIESYASGTSVCNANGTPLDKKLNVVGSVVTNASQGGGTISNNRDLCVYDLSCSSVSFGDSPVSGDEGLATSYIMTLFADGKFLNHKLFNWEELKP